MSDISRSDHGDTYFVFMRCWPGFTDAFPYGDFDLLDDEEAGDAVRHSLAAHLWARRAECRAALASGCRLLQETKTTRGIGEQQELYRDLASARRAHRKKRWEKKGKLHQFDRLANLVGWREGGPLLQQGGMMFTRRIWLAEFSGEDVSCSLVRELERLHLKDREQRILANPRFGTVSSKEMSDGEQLSARSSIQDNRERKDTTGWVGVAEPFLDKAESFLGQLTSDVDTGESAVVSTQRTQPVPPPSSSGYVNAAEDIPERARSGRMSPGYLLKVAYSVSRKNPAESVRGKIESGEFRAYYPLRSRWLIVDVTGFSRDKHQQLFNVPQETAESDQS